MTKHLGNLLVLLAISFATTAADKFVPHHHSDGITFQEWQKEFGKVYKNEEEAKHRLFVFEQNKRAVAEWNAKSRDGVKLSLNQFADLTQDEFKKSVLMPPRKPVIFDESRYAEDIGMSMPVGSLPESFDWRDKGVVTGIKNQGSAGSCWAFSTVGNIEGQWAMAGHNLTSLSEELLVDCDDEEDPAHGHADCGIFGGWPYLAYQYIEKLGGIETEEDYPYCAGAGTCFPCPTPAYNKTLCGPPAPTCNKSQGCSNKLNRNKFVPGLKVKSWQAISKNETEMAFQLMKIGPLSIAINAELLSLYHHGIWHPPFCSADGLDHAILIVGFGVEKGLLEDKPYWIIKNSWGAKWGENGYFRMARGVGQCGVNQQVTSSILE